MVMGRPSEKKMAFACWPAMTCPSPMRAKHARRASSLSLRSCPHHQESTCFRRPPFQRYSSRRRRRIVKRLQAPARVFRGCRRWDGASVGVGAAARHEVLLFSHHRRRPRPRPHRQRTATPHHGQGTTSTRQHRRPRRVRRCGQQAQAQQPWQG